MRNLSFVLLSSLATCALALPLGGCGGSGGGFTASPVIDVVVGSRNNPGAIGIYRDVLRHSGFTADVIIDNGSAWTSSTSIDQPMWLGLENDWLAAALRSNGRVVLWNGFSTMTNNQDPNVTLFVNDPRHMALVGGDLYVAHNQTVISIWRDVTTLVTGDGPDAVINIPASGRHAGITVVNDVLYSTQRYGSADDIFVWNGAAALTTGAAPTAILPASNPRRCLVSNNVLWVQNSGSGGLWFGWGGATALTTGQAADRAIFGGFDLSDRGSFATDGTNGYLGRNYYNDASSAMLTRFRLSDLTTPLAEVTRGAHNFNRVYDLAVTSNVLVGSEKDGGYVFFYGNAAGITNNQVPDGFLFDTRVGQCHDVLAVTR